MQGWAGTQSRAAVLGHGLALRPVVAKSADPARRRMIKVSRRYRKLTRLRPTVAARRGKVVTAAILPALTYDAAIRGLPPSLERTLRKWELAHTGLLPRATPRGLAIGVLGDVLPGRFAHSIFAPLVRYGLERWLALHRPTAGLHPAALVEAFWDGVALWQRTKGTWGGSDITPLPSLMGRL